MTKLDKQEKTPMSYITAGPSKPKSVLDLFLLYRKELEYNSNFNEVNLLQSALVRFVVPGWAGPTPKGARATAQEIASGLEFLKDVPVARLEEALETLTQVFKKLGTPKDAQRPPRYRLNSFVNWAVKKGYFKKDVTSSTKRKTEKYGFKNQYTSRHRNSEVKAEWEKPSKYILGAFEDEYVNDIIQQQFQEIQDFAIRELNCLSEKTQQSNEAQSMRFLGWLYREKKVGSLEDLRIIASKESGLPCIIPVVTLQPNPDDFQETNNYLLAEKKQKSRLRKLQKTS
jgi:hypothetical protein